MSVEGLEQEEARPCGRRLRPSARAFRGKSCWHAAVTGRRPMLRLTSDADVHGEIIRGLCRRLPEIDLTRDPS